MPLQTSQTEECALTLGEGIPGTVLIRLRGLCGGLEGVMGVGATDSLPLLMAVNSSSDDGVVALNDPFVFILVDGDLRLVCGDLSWLGGDVTFEVDTNFAHMLIMSSSRCRASRSSSCSRRRS